MIYIYNVTTQVAIATRTRVIDVPAGQNVFQRGTSTENRQPVLFAFLFAFLFLFLFLCFSFLFFFFLCDRDAFSLIQKTHLIVCQDRLGTNTSQTPASSNKSALVFYIIRTQATTATRRTPCCGAAASL
jgi:hypothetical protein